MKTEARAMFLDRGMKRNNHVCAIFSPRETHVTYYDDEPTSLDEHSVARTPYMVEFSKKSPVVRKGTKLSFVLGVWF